jgi:hypothetical protein
MTNSWTLFFRRLAVACAFSGATAWTSAMCYAIQFAYDDATSPAYQNDDANSSNDTNPANNTNGWQAGDNGGFGFGPWNFDTDNSGTGIQNEHRMDGVPPAAPTSFNSLGTAWTLDNTTGPPGGDVARAGRSFSPLQVGQTLKVVIDNPTAERFFRGYFVRFNSRNGGSGGGNICYGGSACTPGTNPSNKLNMRTFEYFTYGQWGVENGASPNFHQIPLFDTDTAAAGAEIDVTLTAADTYQLTFDPFGPGATYSETGPLADPGQPLDWLEFTFFNTRQQAGVDSEFFIRSVEIVGAAPPGVPGDYNSDGVVNAADYVEWRKHLGTGFQLPNEVSGVTPGSVTQEDYTAWRARFGNPSGSASGATSAGVPEPSTLAMILMAIGSFCARSFRRLRRFRWTRRVAG